LAFSPSPALWLARHKLFAALSRPPSPWSCKIERIGLVFLSPPSTHRNGAFFCSVLFPFIREAPFIPDLWSNLTLYPLPRLLLLFLLFPSHAEGRGIFVPLPTRTFVLAAISRPSSFPSPTSTESASSVPFGRFSTDISSLRLVGTAFPARAPSFALLLADESLPPSLLPLLVFPFLCFPPFPIVLPFYRFWLQLPTSLTPRFVITFSPNESSLRIQA